MNKQIVPMNIFDLKETQVEQKVNALIQSYGFDKTEELLLEEQHLESLAQFKRTKVSMLPKNITKDDIQSFVGDLSDIYLLQAEQAKQAFMFEFEVFTVVDNNSVEEITSLETFSEHVGLYAVNKEQWEDRYIIDVL